MENWQAQHQLYGGKCGICGDSYGDQNPLHAYPGKFATGILGRSYFTPGQVCTAIPRFVRPSLCAKLALCELFFATIFSFCATFFVLCEYFLRKSQYFYEVLQFSSRLSCIFKTKSNFQNLKLVQNSDWNYMRF